MCSVEFPTIRHLTRHQKEQNHHNRNKKQKTAEHNGPFEDHSLEQANLDIQASADSEVESDSDTIATKPVEFEPVEIDDESSTADDVSKRQRLSKAKVNPDPSKVVYLNVGRTPKCDPCHNHEGCRYPTAPRGTAKCATCKRFVHGLCYADTFPDWPEQEALFCMDHIPKSDNP